MATGQPEQQHERVQVISGSPATVFVEHPASHVSIFSELSYDFFEYLVASAATYRKKDGAISNG